MRLSKVSQILSHSLNRVASGSLSLIMCSAAFIHLISFFCNENKSWYSARRLLACLVTLASQDSNPNRSNFSKSICCLSSSDIHPTSGVLTGLELKSAGRIMLAVTILAMGTPFCTSTYSLVLFLSTAVNLLLPIEAGGIGAKNFDSQRELERLLLQIMCHYVQCIPH